MKKFLSDIIQFAVFLFIFYICFIVLSGLFFPEFLRRNLIYTLGGNGFTYTRLKEAKDLRHVDVLFLGSSRAYRSFDTRIFDAAGLTSFNLGTSNQTPVQSLYLLEKYLDQLKPATIVFEVNPDIFSNNGVESAIDIISNEKMDVSLLKMAIDIHHIKVWNTLIYSTFRKSTGLENSFIEGNQKTDQKYIKGGYVLSLTENFDQDAGNSYVCQLNRKQLDAFEKIISLVKSANIKILLVQSPVVPTLYNACSENKNFDRLMNQSSAYINFNKTLNLTDTLHFTDGQHLNQNGVDIFCNEILKLLKSH
jgi:Protein of unknown function (DUF1574)